MKQNKADNCNVMLTLRYGMVQFHVRAILFLPKVLVLTILPLALAQISFLSNPPAFLPVPLILFQVDRCSIET